MRDVVLLLLITARRSVGEYTLHVPCWRLFVLSSHRSRIGQAAAAAAAAAAATSVMTGPPASQVSSGRDRGGAGSSVTAAAATVNVTPFFQAGKQACRQAACVSIIIISNNSIVCSTSHERYRNNSEKLNLLINITSPTKNIKTNTPLWKFVVKPKQTAVRNKANSLLEALG